MFTIKMIRMGQSWTGEMRCFTIPRVGELVYLGDEGACRVRQVAYGLQEDGTHAPMIVLGEVVGGPDEEIGAAKAAQANDWRVPLDGQAEGGDPYSELSDNTRNDGYGPIGIDGF